MKKETKRVVTVLIVIALIIGAYFLLTSKAKEAINPNDPNAGYLTLRLFDKYGNEYDSSGKVVKQVSYSIVEGLSGITAMAFNVKIVNTGIVSLTCNIGSTWVNGIQTGEPYTSFNNNFTKTAQTIPSGEPRGWQGGIIQISPATEALLDPTNYTVETTCTYGQGLYIQTQTKRGSLLITITSETGFTGVWDVFLNKTLNPAEWCGNGIPDSGETCATCPIDVPGCVATNTVKFRPSDITYPSGSAIAYNSTQVCGVGLTAFGYWSTSGILSGTCSASMPTSTQCGGGTGSTKIFTNNLPGEFMSGGASPTLWKSIGGTATMICVCDDTGTQYIVRRYDSTKTPMPYIDTSPTTIGGAEIFC